MGIGKTQSPNKLMYLRIATCFMTYRLIAAGPCGLIPMLVGYEMAAPTFWWHAFLEVGACGVPFRTCRRRLRRSLSHVSRGVPSSAAHPASPAHSRSGAARRRNKGKPTTDSRFPHRRRTAWSASPRRSSTMRCASNVRPSCLTWPALLTPSPVYTCERSLACSQIRDKPTPKVWGLVLAWTIFGLNDLLGAFISSFEHTSPFPWLPAPPFTAFALRSFLLTIAVIQSAAIIVLFDKGVMAYFKV